jgi:hypothetical protein
VGVIALNPVKIFVPLNQGSRVIAICGVGDLTLQKLGYSIEVKMWLDHSSNSSSKLPCQMGRLFSVFPTIRPQKPQ